MREISDWNKCSKLLFDRCLIYLLRNCIFCICYTHFCALQRPQGPVGPFFTNIFIFSDRSKSRFDGGIVIYAKCRADPHRNY